MAAKTFSISTNGAATGQQLTGGSTCALVNGTLHGGCISIEASPDNVLWATIPESVCKSSSTSIAVLLRCAIPKEWYVRPVLINAQATPNIAVVVDDAA
jgi:hypothetical protein